MVDQENDQLIADLRSYLARVAEVPMPAMRTPASASPSIDGATKPRFSGAGRAAAGLAVAIVLAGILATSLAIHRSNEPQQAGRPKTGLAGFLYYNGADRCCVRLDLNRIDLSDLHVEPIIQQRPDCCHPYPPPDLDRIDGGWVGQGGGNVYVGVTRNYRSFFLTKLDGHRLVPVPGLGEPMFTTLQVAPEGILSWTAYKFVDSGTDHTTELHVWDPSTRQQRVILTSPTELLSPSVGPDGSIAVTQVTDEQARDRRPNLLVVRPDGTRLQYQIDEAAGIQWGPQNLLVVTKSWGTSLARKTISLLDPTTGAPRGAIEGWAGAQWRPDRSTLLVFRPLGENDAEFGVATGPDYSRVRTVGRIPGYF